jgi:hypothetical protein
MKFRIPRIRSAVPRVRVPRMPRVGAAAQRLGARTASGARRFASSYRRWRKRRRQRPVRESLFSLSFGGSPSPGQGDQERERQRLRERFRQWRQQRAERPPHGWQTPVRGESLSRMMSAVRDVEQHRVRPPMAPAGRHLRAPSRVPAPRAPVTRSRPPRFRPGR